uniref:F-box domain-containing protein n=1 Tax=Glycine max TaxID=3847 RepID=K7MD22_SOYBN
MSDYLPEALVLQILYRLPPTTLVKCTSVCKAWNKIIRSHDFISSHLLHSLSNHTLSLLFPHYIFYNFNELRFRSSGTINTRNDFHTIAKLCYSFHVVNTVNGVICLSRNRSSHTSYTDLVILWNPFIRRHIQLPTPYFAFKTLLCSYYQLPSMFFVGFGFDSKTNDYKVVRICYLKYYENNDPPLVELYSLNEGASRIIETSSIDVRIESRLLSQCFLHGNVHWIAFENHMRELHFQYCVLIFNVEEENFKKIRLPIELSTLRSHDDLTISVINGCLSVIHYACDRERATHTVFNIWMKREPELWNKMYKVNYFQTVFDSVSLASSTSDEIFEFPLCGQFVPLGLVEYDREEITKLRIQSRAYHLFFNEYTPSLVLFNRENGPIWCPISKRCLFHLSGRKVRNCIAFPLLR